MTGRRLASTFRALWPAWALASMFALLPGVAHAFPVDVQVVGKVSVGKQPRLLIHASANTTNTVVELTREDGRAFTFSLGSLTENQQKEVTLDGSVGRHDYKGTMALRVDGEKEEIPLSFSTVVAPPLDVTVRTEDLDLEAQTLRFKTSRKVQSGTLSVMGLGGETLSKQALDLAANESGAAMFVRFGPVQADQLLRLELYVEDADGFFRTVTLTPWSVHIPHEEVLFASNSAKIAEDQEPKLTESLALIQDKLGLYKQLQGVGLYIAGHSDRRGKPDHNRDLSRRRAQSIAAWFVSHGLHIKVLFEGFGESALKVKTADEVDEPRNRRVDYILSVEPPTIVGGTWRALN